MQQLSFSRHRFAGIRHRVYALVTCGLVGTLMTACAAGHQPVKSASSHYPGLHIHLVKVTKAKRGNRNVEMVIDNQSGLRKICIDGNAVGTDKKEFGVGFILHGLTNGRHQSIAFPLIRSNDVFIPLPYGFFLRATNCEHHTLYRWTFLDDHGEIRPVSFVDYIEHIDTHFNVVAAFQKDFNNHDHGDLSILLAQLDSPKAVDMDGDPYLDNFRWAVNNYADNQDDMLSGLKKLARWHHRKPHSAAAALAQAIYLAHYAWHLRGGRGSGVSDDFTLGVFRQRMQQAEDLLKKTRADAGSNPLWYDTYLRIAIDLNEPFHNINTVYQAGIKKFPHYIPLYVDMAAYYAPLPPNPGKRKSDWASVDRVVRQAVAANVARDGVSDYARIYRDISVQRATTFNLLRDSRATWPEFRDSFLDLIKRYPSADNENWLASYACEAGDKNTYLQMELKIHGKYDNNFWLPNYTRDVCDHKFLTDT